MIPIAEVKDQIYLSVGKEKIQSKTLIPAKEI
jgi:hypothetical protein